MATFLTRDNLAQRIIKHIGLVSGTSVQTYTQPQVEASIQSMFDMMFRKRFWEHLTERYTYTLDGTLGIITSNVDTLLKGFEDVQDIFISDTEQKVVKATGNRALRVTGSTPKYWTPLKWGHASFTTRVLQFWPKTATGDVDIVLRTKPDEFTTDDYVPIAADVMVHACSWDLLENDGINPTAAAKEQMLYGVAYEDYVADLSAGDIGHGSTGNVPITIRTI